MNQNTTHDASEDARPDVACSAELGRAGADEWRTMHAPCPRCGATNVHLHAPFCMVEARATSACIALADAGALRLPEHIAVRDALIQLVCEAATPRK